MAQTQPFVKEKAMNDTIITKRCSRCKQIKPISEFHKNRAQKDGYRNHCKNCVKCYQQSEKGKEVYRAINQRYNKTEKCKIRRKRYMQSEKGKRKSQRKNLRQYKRYPERMKAYSAINNAIKTSKIPRVAVFKCTCGNQAQQYHHHKGYAKKHWFDVIAICVPCHILCHS